MLNLFFLQYILCIIIISNSLLYHIQTFSIIFISFWVTVSTDLFYVILFDLAFKIFLLYNNAAKIDNQIYGILSYSFEV